MIWISSPIAQLPFFRSVARPPTCRIRDNVPKSDYCVFSQEHFFTPSDARKAYFIGYLRRPDATTAASRAVAVTAVFAVKNVAVLSAKKIKLI